MAAVAEDERRETRVQIRGTYRDLGELVQAGFPEAFHAGPAAPVASTWPVVVCAREPIDAPSASQSHLGPHVWPGSGGDRGRLWPAGTVPTHPELLMLGRRWLADEGRLRPSWVC